MENSNLIVIDLIAGARPNFMKIAPIIEALLKAKAEGKNIRYRLVHTGQHYDTNMSRKFFDDLGIPEPDVNLGAGGGTQAEQTAKIMVAYEKLLLETPCNLCLVVGDVNSTMACSIVSKKLGIPVAHVEAGIRSYDLTMPEEINRMVTDSITDYFFTTTELAGQNLKQAGISQERIFLVGNTMIDTLIRQRSRFRKPEFWDELNLIDGHYMVMTLHRPSNVDKLNELLEILKLIDKNTHQMPVVFPVHPRTFQVLNQDTHSFENIQMVEPLGYLEFNYLVEHAKAVITDSGGITEETTVMGIPCLTLRENTERPETITMGTNELVGTNPDAIVQALEKLHQGHWKKGSIPEKWDGKTSKRIVDHLIRLTNTI